MMYNRFVENKHHTGKLTGILLASFVVVVVGIFVICLYATPNFRPWGMSGVFIQNKYMTYVGDKLDYIFEQNNLIIESDSAEIHVRVRKDDQMDKGYAQVFEDSNGVSFNSLNRVQLEFYESHDQKTGEAYVKIKVREPKGLMASRVARVYINLKSEHLLAYYRLILNTNRSNVTFDADDDAAKLNIQKIDINGTGRVEFAKPLKTEITTMNITSSGANVNCTAPIRDVTINGNSRDVRFGVIENDLTVTGASNNVSAESIGGNVKIVSTHSTLYVTKNVAGNINVTANTNNLTVASADAQVTLIGTRTDELIADGSIYIGRVFGNSFVRMDKGSLTLGSRSQDMGVYGNVDVEKRFNGLEIVYANESSATGSCTVRAYDGTINVAGARGLIDIVTTSMGNADVNVSIAVLTPNSKINVEGSREPNHYGHVVVKFLADGEGAVATNSFYAVGSSKFTCAGSVDELKNSTVNQAGEVTEYRVYKLSGTIASPSVSAPTNNGTGALRIKTANTITIGVGTY